MTELYALRYESTTPEEKEPELAPDTEDHEGLRKEVRERGSAQHSSTHMMTWWYRITRPPLSLAGAAAAGSGAEVSTSV